MIVSTIYIEESHQSILKEISPRCLLVGLMLKLKLQYFSHLMWRADSFEKTLMLGKNWGQEKGTTEDEMVGWHHRLNGHGFGWPPGVGDGQGGLACCGSWDHKESDMTERLNWTEFNLSFTPQIIKYLTQKIPTDLFDRFNGDVYIQFIFKLILSTPASCYLPTT